ncbi:MAG: sulfatase [Planctomycetota bacterium]
MSRARTFAATVLAVIVLWGGNLLHAAPNVVVIVIDDLGWRDVGYAGSSFYKTPHIDRLAASGVRFTTAYAACPVCSPTRAALFTGKAPARLLLTDWLPSGRWNPAARLREARFVRALPPEEITLAEVFRAAGYETVHVGKWHLGGEPFSLPEHHGFDVNVGGNAHGAPGSHFFPYAGNWKIPTTPLRATWNVLPDGHDGEYLADRLTDEAVAFILRPHTRPFFLHLAHYGVHTPLQAKADVTARYEAVPEAERQGKPVYAAMVESIDDSVGRVLDALDGAGVADDTLVIFTSDNGGFSGATSNAPLRGHKGALHEGGIRVPLVIRLPGGRAAGREVAAPVTTMDLAPTCLAVAGLPPRPHQHLDGIDLVPLVDGAASPRAVLHWHYPHYSDHPATAPGGAIRRGDWKLVESFDPEGIELYDLATDPGESLNRAAERPDLVASLAGDLAAWRREVGAEMMRPNPDHDPAQLAREAQTGRGKKKRGQVED